MPLSDASSAKNRQLFLYFSTLTLILFSVQPDNLMDIPTAYILKNHLHASAAHISIFRLVTGIPMYLGFLFGMTRDQWNPFGWRDRGYFRLFGPLAIAAFLWLSVTRLSYMGMVLGMLLAMTAFKLISAAFWGLTALVGQEEAMSGRLSALTRFCIYVALIVAYFASGFITGHLSPPQTFLLAAALVIPLCWYGVWKPRAVFSHAYDNPHAQKTNFFGDVKRLVQHRAIYPVAVIMLLWNFMPGFNTPMQFYFSNQIHAADSVYSYFNCIFYGSFIPTVVLYGFLCTRFPVRKLLWWGAWVGVPSMIPLAFIHSSSGALWMAVLMGLMSGFASAAFYDLAIRSCPAGLQGTLMMAVDAVGNLAFRSSDVVGTKIYGLSSAHGFQYCVIAMTATYAMMLPTLLLVPKELVATSDGEATPVLDAQMLAELGTASAAG